MKKIIHDLTLTMPLLITMLTNGFSQTWTGDYVTISDENVVNVTPANAADTSAPVPMADPSEFGAGGVDVSNYSLTTMDVQTDIPPMPPLCEYDPGACAGSTSVTVNNPNFFVNTVPVDIDCGGPCPETACPTAGQTVRVTFAAESSGSNLVKLFVEIQNGASVVSPTFPEMITTAPSATYENTYILHSGYCTTGNMVTFMPKATNAAGDTDELDRTTGGNMPYDCRCP